MQNGYLAHDGTIQKLSNGHPNFANTGSSSNDVSVKILEITKSSSIDENNSKSDIPRRVCSKDFESGPSHEIKGKNNEDSLGSQQEKSNAFPDNFIDSNSAIKENFEGHKSPILPREERFLNFSKETLETARKEAIPSPALNYDRRVSNVPVFASHLNWIPSLKPESPKNEPVKMVPPAERDIVMNDSKRLNDTYIPDQANFIPDASPIQASKHHSVGLNQENVNSIQGAELRAHDLSTRHPHSNNTRRASEAAVKPHHNPFNTARRSTMISSPPRNYDRRISMVPLLGSEMKLLETFKTAETQIPHTHEAVPEEAALPLTDKSFPNDESTRIEDLAGSLLDITADINTKVVSSPHIEHQRAKESVSSKVSGIEVPENAISNLNQSNYGTPQILRDDNAKKIFPSSVTTGTRRASEAVVNSKSNPFNTTRRGTMMSSPPRNYDRRVSMVPLLGSEMKLLDTFKTAETQKLPEHELGPIGITSNQDKEGNGIPQSSTKDPNTMKDNGDSHFSSKSTVFNYSANS
jgi:hypothetical protein